MEFGFETVYNQEALTVMARAIRKTARKKRSRRLHIFSQNHAQIYSKKNMTGGTAEEFCQFIKAVTGKEIQNI